MTVMALPWIGRTMAFGDVVRKPRVRARNWLGLGSAVAFERCPDAGEGLQRPIIVQGEPDHILFLSLRIGLWSVFREAVERDQASVPGLHPGAPVRRRSVADIGDRRSAFGRRRRREQVLCLGCGGPLRNREGKFALKYFRVGGSRRPIIGGRKSKLQ
jgi:hypothetical protein